ncbi:MAG: hypothetical protein VSS75_006445, partial [Candidatus Parabeggiatoa sp.]|nr:hypothetical protein [Candidatus Parabeggiatoa sp.]
LSKITGLPKNFPNNWKLCGLNIKSEPCETPEAVQDKIEAFAPKQGWLCFQSEVAYFCQHDFCDNHSIPSHGIILYGEVVKDQSSLHIREDGQGEWIVTELTETQGDEYLVEEKRFLGEGKKLTETQGDEYLVEEKRFLGEGKKLTPDELYYRIYWQHDKQYGYRQCAARFTEFRQEQNANQK